jgi:hypothetical protein
MMVVFSFENKEAIFKICQKFFFQIFGTGNLGIISKLGNK